MTGKSSDGTYREHEIPSIAVAQAEAIASENADPGESSGGGPPAGSAQQSNQSDLQRTIRGSREGKQRSADIESDNVGEVPIEEAPPPPPPYSEVYGSVNTDQEGLNTRADKSRRISNLLVPALRSQLKVQDVEEPSVLPPGYIPPSLGGVPGEVPPPPPMNVVVQVVGSRGDVQPFVALGRVLKQTYKHRVRLATHPVFREFVEENGIEFFSIGGDPAELMAFMVKNPGLMPGKDALKGGDIGKRRKGMYEIVRGCWRSCFEAGDGTGIAISDDQPLEVFDPSNKPFVADAIIANPPSFAHIHCAEKLGIPVHLMFTMPWSPTQSFPHPLANIQSSNADTSMTNFLSYALVEMMTWQGLGDIINRFREKSLGLEPVGLLSAPGLASRLRIPYTYCWSPALIPKPKDWGSHITISGFYFLSLADSYQPAPDLAEFLNAGPPPVYIGFGSIVVDDPNAMTKLIFEAVKLTGQRALVSKGWGGFGADQLGVPDGVFMLGNVPHDWLFKRVSCVVHHGGAGTTAAGVAMGKPTVIVPFFGDQPFWGAMVAKAGAGPEPIHNKKLTAENLAEAINDALKPATLEKAKELGAKIASEKGSDIGAKSFHDAQDVDSLRCSLAPSRVAVWRVKRTNIRLSGLAAAVLGNEGLLDFKELKLYRSKEYPFDDGPMEPFTGATSALLGTLSGMMMGIADIPMDIFKTISRKSSRTSKDGAAPDSSKPSTQQPSQSSSTAELPAQGLGEAAAGEDDASLALSSPSRISSIDSQPSATTLNSTGGTGLSTTSTNASLGSDSSRPAHARSSSAQTETGNSFDMKAALGATKGVGRVVDAGLKSPMDFTLSLARGFHNAPKLYGDESVRPHDRITGFQGGLRAAGKEFGYGFYDGISGIVTQPVKGAKKEGFAGFLKGFGKGVGGIVLKPGAAIWGLPGYTLKGIYMELQKYWGSSVRNYIIAARTAQGYEDWNAASQEERLDIVNRWHAAQVDLAKQKKQWLSRRPHEAKTPVSGGNEPPGGPQRPSSTLSPTQSIGQAPPSAVGTAELASSGSEDHSDAAFERAITESVSATSTGNAKQDAMIERAIRASVAELRRTTASSDHDEEDAMQRAVRASIAEANRPRSGERRAGKEGVPDEEHDKQLEAAIRMSMQDRGGTGAPRSAPQDWDDSDVDTDDDENIKAAIRNSTSQAEPRDEELETALEESRKAQEKEASADKLSEEERVVLEYVKKQSLMEEEHRRARDGG